MKKILLIDYYGICNSKGRAVGHSPKVLKEYGTLLKSEYEVGAAVSPCLIEGAEGEFNKIYQLKYDICVEDRMSIIKRISDKCMIFSNIIKALEIDGYDVYWFYKTDFFLFFFLCFRNMKKWKNRHNRKLMAQVYQGSFGSGNIQKVLDWFYKKGMSRFDGITYSQKQTADIHFNMLYFPDYYYDTDKYIKYRSLKKENKVVCLGTMNSYKKLDALIDAFNCNGYPLEIRGHFFDKDFYQRLCAKANHNIVVEDRVLTEKEYYGALAGAKYTVLPYDMKLYQSRTSGILVESMFLDTVAIAPEQLLQENHIEGIGYERMEELSDAVFFERRTVIDNSAVKKEFDQEEAGRRLREFIEGL